MYIKTNYVLDNTMKESHQFLFVLQHVKKCQF